MSSLDIQRKTKELAGISPDAIPYDQLMRDQQPVILKGVARQWPLVQKGLQSLDAAMDHIASFYGGRPVVEYR
ncbi:MAG TPA: cupin, partial [Hyphomonas sp.]|nr:cupin [Hyphomonas sp.]